MKPTEILVGMLSLFSISTRSVKSNVVAPTMSCPPGYILSTINSKPTCTLATITKVEVKKIRLTNEMFIKNAIKLKEKSNCKSGFTLIRINTPSKEEKGKIITTTDCVKFGSQYVNLHCIPGMVQITLVDGSSRCKICDDTIGVATCSSVVGLTKTIATSCRHTHYFKTVKNTHICQICDAGTATSFRNKDKICLPCSKLASTCVTGKNARDLTCRAKNYLKDKRTCTECPANGLKATSDNNKATLEDCK